MADTEGRRCPVDEHACRTPQAARLWDAVQRPGGWTGGGMAPRRIDRAAVRARLSDIDGWIIEPLMDAFEGAALAAIRKVEDRQAKQKSRTPREPGSRDEEQRHD